MIFKQKSLNPHPSQGVSQDLQTKIPSFNWWDVTEQQIDSLIKGNEQLCQVWVFFNRLDAHDDAISQVGGPGLAC